MAHPSRAQGWRGPGRYGRSPLIGERWFLPPLIHVGGSSNPAASNILHQDNPAAVEEPHRVAGLKQGASPTRTVYVGGKLLLQTFLDAPSNQLKLSFQLVSATVTVAGTQLHIITQFL